MDVAAREPVKLACRTKGTGRRLIFLHPIGLSGRFWQGVIGRLAPDFTCISVDLRGHGDSPWNRTSFTIDDLAGDVVACIDQTGAGEVVLVGCSMGGMVAQAAALRAPHLVAGLVVSNSAASVPAAARKAVRERGALAARDRTLGAEDCIDRWFPAQYRANSAVRIEVIRDMLLATNPDVIASSWVALSDLQLTDRLTQFDGWALVVTGEFDLSAPPEASAMHARLFRRGAATVVPGAGHLTPYEAPDVFAGLIRRAVSDGEEGRQ
jgi:3-oxoadipate enol-lactonase